MKQPFQATVAELDANTLEFVREVIASLDSFFMVMPKGDGFIEYERFAQAYESLKKATGGFATTDVELLLDCVLKDALVVIVIRTILGFSPPEWGSVATEASSVEVKQGYVRSLDRKIRLAPDAALRLTKITRPRLEALLSAASDLLHKGAGEAPAASFHRLDKVDTSDGMTSLRHVAGFGVPHPVLLYERLLGSPFLSHRNSVSEHVGDLLETPIESILTEQRISFRKTKRAEKIPGFDQAPDFCIPDEFAPRVVIEAKISEDDGTARDKITRIQRLAFLSAEFEAQGRAPFEVIACVDGRGFCREADVAKLVLATDGKVFTLKNLGHLVEHSRLKDFAVKGP